MSGARTGFSPIVFFTLHTLYHYIPLQYYLRNIKHFFRIDMYRLSYERRGDISFIARGTISYFVTSKRSERGTKYDIVTRAIKLILPSVEYDNLFITYLCLYLGQKSDYIFTLFIL